MPEQSTPNPLPTAMQTLELCKSKLAARLAPITNNILRAPVHSPSHAAAAREFYGILALLDRITKTQLEEQKLGVQGTPDAKEEPRDEIEETQVWMKSLGVWMASLEERLNERKVRLQSLEKMVKEFEEWCV